MLGTCVHSLMRHAAPSAPIMLMPLLGTGPAKASSSSLGISITHEHAQSCWELIPMWVQVEASHGQAQ